MDAAHDLEALAKRVEAAAGPDRELDVLIHFAIVLGEPCPSPEKYTASPRVMDHECEEFGDDAMCFRPVILAYTRSLDAAMSVVPDGLFPTIDFVTKRCWLRDANGCDVPHGPAYGFAKTVPASIVAASLRALSQGVNDDHA